MITTQILAAIFVFGIVVTIHELGHFIAAKSLGMKVEEFAIGFGSKVFSYRKGETLYSVRAIPLGGFNKIAGMDPEEELDERAYLNQPLWSRAIVIVAGSAMNLILPVLIFFCIYANVGIDRPIDDRPIVGEAIVGQSAEEAGLLSNDLILMIDGKSVATWSEMIQRFQECSPDEAVTLLIERNGNRQELSVTPKYDSQSKRNLIGISARTHLVKVGVLDAAGLAVKQSVYLIKAIAGGLYEMLTGNTAVELSGPIGVARVAGDIASSDGIIGLLRFVAFLSINLGLVNLLPIPALDGGHLLVLLVESIRGKQLNPKQAVRIQMVGVALLLSLFVLVTAQDVFRIFN
jgi:Predicted membrane-associated Zn-dependent proteases 1